VLFRSGMTSRAKRKRAVAAAAVLATVLCDDDLDDFHELAVDHEIRKLQVKVGYKHALPERPDFARYPTQLFRKLFRFEYPDVVDLVAELGVPDPVITPTGCTMPAVDAFCLVCYRFSFPSTWDRVTLFGRRTSVLQAVFMHTVNLLFDRWAHLLTGPDMGRLGPQLELFASRIRGRDGFTPVERVWAFLDGTHMKICRPKSGQRGFYQHRKASHTVVLQGLTTPDGMIVQMFGPLEGVRHDQRVLTESGLQEMLRAYMTARFGQDIRTWYYVYADKGYAISDVIQPSYKGRDLQQLDARVANIVMSAKRVSVEHSFRKFKSLWAFNNFYADCKVNKSPLCKYFIVSCLLTNLHTTCYESQVGKAYCLRPPTAHNYLHGIFDAAQNSDDVDDYTPLRDPARDFLIDESVEYDAEDEVGQALAAHGRI